MSEFKVGDRVAWSSMRGTVVEVTDEAVIARWDLKDHVAGLKLPCPDLTLIEEPKPWQGECDLQGCMSLKTTGQSYIYHLPQYPKHKHGCFHYCEKHWVEMQDHWNKRLKSDQEFQLSKSREWMQERYPKDAKWTEATS